MSAPNSPHHFPPPRSYRRTFVDFMYFKPNWTTLLRIVIVNIICFGFLRWLVVQNPDLAVQHAMTWYAYILVLAATTFCCVLFDMLIAFLRFKTRRDIFHYRPRSRRGGF